MFGVCCGGVDEVCFVEVDNFVVGFRCSNVVGDQKVGECDVWFVDEVIVFIGEMLVSEKFFEILFEGLCCIGVFYFIEEYGVEFFVGCGVVDFDDDVGMVIVQDWIVWVICECFECVIVVDESVVILCILCVYWMVCCIEWFVEIEIIGIVMVDFDVSVV